MLEDDPPGATELLVVGAGPGGYVAAIRAAQLGLDVTLVDRDGYGGTCLNHGCIPSKALLTATGRVDAVTGTGAEGMGIYADPYIDMAELVEWKDGVVDRLTSGVEKLCETSGIQSVQGTASFLDESTVVIEEQDGSTTEISFEHAVVATGSRPIEIPGFDYADSPVLDARQALALETTPERLVVVGAGYIGMELATVYARLGTDVTVVEMLEEALPGFETALSDPVKEHLTSMGVDFYFGRQATEWREEARGIAVATEDTDADRLWLDCDRVLVAVGRQPVTSGLGLENAGLATNRDGFVPTGPAGRTEVETIFAVGDVAGEPMLAHEASHAGIVAAETIAGNDPDHVDQPVPAAVFTEPEIATVGLNPDEANEEGYEPIVGEFPIAASGRALTTGHDAGFVRVVGESDTGRVLGCQIVGPEASELVGEVGVSMAAGATLADLAETMRVHPTLSEAVMEAASHAFGQAIHRSN